MIHEHNNGTKHIARESAAAVAIFPEMFQQTQSFYFMMTSSNGNIFRVTGPLRGEVSGLGEFPVQRPVTRSFDVFFDLRLNRRLSKQP